MKKVMLTITSLGGGGAERVVTVWANQLHKAGCDVSVLTYGRKDGEYSLDADIPVHTVAQNKAEYLALGYFSRLRRMREILKKEKPDVLINFLPRMQIWMMLASFGLRVKRIETVRVSPDTKIKTLALEHINHENHTGKPVPMMINEGEIEKLYLLDVECGDDVMIDNRGEIRKIITLG